MAHLLTHHDKYHIHALLGLTTLLHFLFRWIMLFVYGDAFVNKKMFWFNVLTMLLHSALPLSALPLPIPHSRNFSAPMIWQEFRLHSLTFASRHMLSTIMSLAFPLNRAIQLIIVHLTIFTASLVSDVYGDRQRRTTNTMPYALEIGSAEVQHTKNMYIRAQFMATAFTLTGRPSLSFIPTLGIQVAPFLMTLVRKGKISVSAYHMIYAWTVLLPLPATMILVYHASNMLHDILTAFAIGALALFFRAEMQLRKHTCWLMAPGIIFIIQLYFSVTAIQLNAVCSTRVFHIVIIAGLLRNLYLIPHIIVPRLWTS